MNRAQIRREHRTIDLQRPVVDAKKLYQVLCLCGKRSLPGSRSAAEADQKAHRAAMVLVQ